MDDPVYSLDDAVADIEANAPRLLTQCAFLKASGQISPHYVGGKVILGFAARVGDRMRGVRMRFAPEKLTKKAVTRFIINGCEKLSGSFL